jgi:hypothetical protein
MDFMITGQYCIPQKSEFMLLNSIFPARASNMNTVLKLLNQWDAEVENLEPL